MLSGNELEKCRSHAVVNRYVLMSARVHRIVQILDFLLVFS